jgi:flagellar biosynthesis anti-sigma factor FlgM
MELLQEAFRQRRERIEGAEQTARGRKKRPSPGDRLRDPSIKESARKALELIEKAPDVRRDRVEEIRKALQEGSLRFDSRSVADRLLQESILNELL